MARRRTTLAEQMMRAGFDTARLAADTQFVIAHRLFSIAAGSMLPAEAVRMVAEKQAALVEGNLRMGQAIAAGKKPAAVAEAGLAPARKRVRANRKRLAAAKGKQRP